LPVSVVGDDELQLVSTLHFHPVPPFAQAGAAPLLLLPRFRPLLVPELPVDPSSPEEPPAPELDVPPLLEPGSPKLEGGLLLQPPAAQTTDSAAATRNTATGWLTRTISDLLVLTKKECLRRAHSVHRVATTPNRTAKICLANS
jgi:hypothetical protein